MKTVNFRLKQNIYFRNVNVLLPITAKIKTHEQATKPQN